MLDRDDDACLSQIDCLTPAGRIAALNDAFRRYRTSGRLAVTAGVIALGHDALPAILEQVATFCAFDDGNDPYGEHDFGSFANRDARLFWKIDYYDRTLTHGSPDPADPAVTTRVLTVMLAAEY